MRAAVIQMVSTADLNRNLEQAERLLADAAAAGAELVLLPENFALFDSGAVAALAQDDADHGVLQRWLGDCARRLNLWVLAGSLPAVTRPDGSRISDGRVRSRLVVFDNRGRWVHSYDKRHLFDVDVGDAQSRYRESERFEPGDDVATVDTPWGKVGLSICYDLRFAGHYQRLRALGAEILVVPSAFTRVTGEAHWEVLLRARAIETQSYVLGANQGGRHGPTRETWGHSMIVDPWGEVLACVEESGPGIAVTQLDLAALQRCRREMPVWAHTRDHC
ncbi:carbon-nitrogen hydrolase family protein [Marinobacterium litorale]|uniref:carbon-nitrogen hydrolase family protein n=1 Tax=Marinobacterium litorale TaxID=404770 RepID=UPI0004252879|nr:carbon-nitrogen hydrolase family protein [Marinobacterium litorale]